MARRRPAIDWLVYAVVRWTAMLLQMFPVDWNLKTARLAGAIWYRIIRRHRNRACSHLRLAYGTQLTEPQIEQLAHVIRVEHLFGLQLEMARDIGQVIVESIPQGAKIESIKISKSLVPEER